MKCYALFIDFEQAYDTIHRGNEQTRNSKEMTKMALDENKLCGTEMNFRSIFFSSPEGSTIDNVIWVLEIIIIRNSKAKISGTIMSNEHQCADDLTILVQVDKQKQDKIRGDGSNAETK